MAIGPFEGVFLLLFALVLALAIAIFVLSIVVTVQAYQAGREGWWVYLIAVFINPLNLVAVIAWFAYLKDHPIEANGKPFL